MTIGATTFDYTTTVFYGNSNVNTVPEIFVRVLQNQGFVKTRIVLTFLVSDPKFLDILQVSQTMSELLCPPYLPYLQNA